MQTSPTGLVLRFPLERRKAHGKARIFDAEPRNNITLLPVVFKVAGLPVPVVTDRRFKALPSAISARDHICNAFAHAADGPCVAALSNIQLTLAGLISSLTDKPVEKTEAFFGKNRLERRDGALQLPYPGKEQVTFLIHRLHEADSCLWKAAEHLLRHPQASYQLSQCQGQICAEIKRIHETFGDASKGQGA